MTSCDGGDTLPMHVRKKWTLRGAVLTVFTLTQCASIAAHGQVALPGAPCRVDPQPSWTDVEKWVWSRLCVGEIADLTQRDGRKLDPSLAEGWDEKRRLSPEFLEMILLHKPWSSALPRQGVRIVGAYFDAPVDLAESSLEHPLWLHDSRFAGTVLQPERGSFA